MRGGVMFFTRADPMKIGIGIEKKQKTEILF